MPIEVHCPNPGCAKVHLVKNKYAGMRGKCPACSTWMYIPKTETVPTMASPRPEGSDESAAWQSAATSAQRRSESRHVTSRGSLEETESLPAIERQEDRRENRAGRRHEEEDHTQDTPTEKTKRQSHWPVVILLLLGIVSLLAISATPFLEVAEYKGVKVGGIKEDDKLYVMAVPAGGALLGLLALAPGLFGRRFGFVSLFLVYLTALLSAGLLFLALTSFHEQWAHFAALQAKVGGDVNLSLGQYLWVGLGGAGGACLFFILAAVVMHRRWWSRLLAFFFLAGVASLGAVWLYRVELHIDGLEQYLRF